MRLTDSFVVGDTVVEVALADITTADVDVIVNSVCDYFHFGTGVSGSIQHKAGPSVMLPTRELATQTSLESGSVWGTDSGRLPYKYVFHAISSKCAEGTTAEILQRCTKSALDLARSKNVNSIAFPALGTGEMDFDIHEAATVMINTAVLDCKENRGVNRILFCLLRPDAFTSFFREAVKASVTEQTLDVALSQDAQDDNPPDKGRSLLGNLSQCQPGKDGWSSFEECATALFQFLFVPPLQPPRIQSRTVNGLNIRDAVFPNPTENGFWSLLDSRYTASLVPLECKNYVDPVGQDAVNQLSRYLRGKAIGKVGFLASRTEPAPSAIEARTEVFRDLDQIVVFLNDFDFTQLVELKRVTGKPDVYLQRKLDDFALSY